MQTIERTRNKDHSTNTHASGELARLRAENAMLLTAVASANAALTAAPSWHEGHRTVQRLLRNALDRVCGRTRPKIPVRRVA